MPLPKPKVKLADARNDAERQQIQSQIDAYIRSILDAPTHVLTDEHKRDLGRAVASALPRVLRGEL